MVSLTQCPRFDIFWANLATIVFIAVLVGDPLMAFMCKKEFIDVMIEMVECKCYVHVHIIYTDNSNHYSHGIPLLNEAHSSC